MIQELFIMRRSVFLLFAVLFLSMGYAQAEERKLFAIEAEIPGHDGTVMMDCPESTLCKKSVPITIKGKTKNAKISLTVSKKDRRNPRANSLYKYHLTVETGSGKILNSAFFSHKGTFIYSQTQKIKGILKHWYRKGGREVASNLGKINFTMQYKALSRVNPH